MEEPKPRSENHFSKEGLKVSDILPSEKLETLQNITIPVVPNNQLENTILNLTQCVGLLKLDGVGPVDNRPSTEKDHHYVQKKN